MHVTRRSALALGAGAAVLVGAALRSGGAEAAAEDTAKAISDLAGGKEPQAGRITLTAPEIAENGNTVPISVSVDGDLAAPDAVETVTIFAEGNPNPGVVSFHFTPLSGSAEASTRMRLAKTQNVIAVAKMRDGSVYMDKKEVKVTIGGCGG
ncbi:thiosulfate oxidation carrier protein SoxY [Propylenella binzhouense]|uniref:Thiosulfate oxidation carrier protein SoxY n=1 Tax=Propylenella binzhouense TaxID=2555902 RepID=A0A964T9F7_9HYPH|nr:thiosulfate oxidation carrier protein SoxY [Propylenella binzhouense]MYZ49767.1 thiosulfate oxidation carrier protein SoxY [Propylenella binzhouense]